MIKSMTGYGKGETALSDGGRLSVEIRSVNHRYNEMTVKLPRVLLPYENEVKKRVQERLKRGKIEVYIQLETALAGNNVPVVNLPLARAYLEAFRALKDDLALVGDIDVRMIAGQRDVITAGESNAPTEAIAEQLVTVVNEAVAAADLMREREGKALLDELVQRRRNVAQLMERVAERAPIVVREHAAKMKERVLQLSGEANLDEARFAQEIAILADRGDITEEIVRFRSHLVQFDDTIKSDEPVGRRLDFLIQEMNREVNTVGSKANDAEIAAHVVELKAELEKIREQVQNVE